MSGGSSCRPAPPPPPSSGQSPGSRSAGAGQTGLGRPARLLAGRSRRQSVRPSLPRDTQRARPQGRGGAGRAGAAGMGGDRQHYYGKHGRQPPPCTRAGPWEGARECRSLPGAPAPPQSPASTPHPSLPREPLRVPSKSPHPKGPSLKPSPQYSCGVPPGTLPSPPSALVAPFPAPSPGGGLQLVNPMTCPPPEAGRGGRSAGSLRWIPGTQDPLGASEGGWSPSAFSAHPALPC